MEKQPLVFDKKKDSFWTVKGLLLHTKTNPFAMQKDYIFFSV